MKIKIERVEHFFTYEDEREPGLVHVRRVVFYRSENYLMWEIYLGNERLKILKFGTEEYKIGWPTMEQSHTIFKNFLEGYYSGIN